MVVVSRLAASQEEALEVVLLEEVALLAVGNLLNTPYKEVVAHIYVPRLLFCVYYAKSTMVIPAPPKSTCSSATRLTPRTVFRYSRIACLSAPVPVP